MSEPVLLEETSGQSARSCADGREAVKAIFEKPPPGFTGR
jgi:hypothetical protein